MSQVSNPICLFGAGGHGCGVASQIASVTGRVPIFADEMLPLGTELAGTSVRFAKLEEIGEHPLIVTIGSAVRRRAVQERAVALGLSVTYFVADVGHYFAAPPGPGSVVLAGSIVNSGADISEGVIVNCGAIVEHGCRIGAYSHVAPGAVIAGDVELGADVWIGANATVLQGLSICAGTMIGAGAVVTKAIMVPGVYVGQPARRIDLPRGIRAEEGVSE